MDRDQVSVFLFSKGANYFKYPARNIKVCPIDVHSLSTQCDDVYLKPLIDIAIARFFFSFILARETDFDGLRRHVT